jgi:aspartate-semialdehyde dehydrogenase
MKKYNIAVLGATGNVGREVLEILEQRSFPYQNIYALASFKSAGKKITFGKTKKDLLVQDVEHFDFSKVDIVIASCGAANIKKYADKITQSGAFLIDNSSAFRMEADIPLIIPEVNSFAIKGCFKTKIIANPNCSTIAMVVALKPIHDVFEIKRVVVCTYQSVSGAGLLAMEELKAQSLNYLQGNKLERLVFPHNIAFNCIPQIDVAMENGQTKEEWKMQEETKKILDANIKVHANCVRVPTLRSHGEFVNIETNKNITKEEAQKIWQNAQGVILLDDLKNNIYATPDFASNKDEVFVSRVKKDYSAENALSFWCVADNLRKGAALNAVQIGEKLIELL